MCICMKLSFTLTPFISDSSYVFILPHCTQLSHLRVLSSKIDNYALLPPLIHTKLRHNIFQQAEYDSTRERVLLSHKYSKVSGTTRKYHKASL